MPTLTFQLANPRIGLKAKEDSDEWSLSFDATIELPEYDHDVGPEAFDVICDGKRYDGFTLAGRVRIGLHPSPDRPDGEDEKDELRTKLGYIRIDEFGENNPPNFLIDTSSLPTHSSICSKRIWRTAVLVFLYKQYLCGTKTNRGKSGRK